jgi:hypothetical protein
MTLGQRVGVGRDTFTRVEDPHRTDMEVVGSPMSFKERGYECEIRLFETPEGTVYGRVYVWQLKTSFWYRRMT